MICCHCYGKYLRNREHYAIYKCTIAELKRYVIAKMWQWDFSFTALLIFFLDSLHLHVTFICCILCIHIKDVRIVNDYEISYEYLSFLCHFTRTHTQTSARAHRETQTHAHTYPHPYWHPSTYVVKNSRYFCILKQKHSTRCRGGWYHRLCRVTQLNGFNYFVNQAFDNNVKDNWNFPFWRQC